MCLFPGSNILIPPTERARKVADYMKVAVALHLVLSIYLMLGGRYIDGVMDLLGAVIGFYSIKNAEGYSFQCVLCYCVFCGMDIFWALLRLILYFSNASSTDSGDLNGWQYNVYISGMIVAPFIYTFATVSSYYLYKELRNIVNEASGAGGGEEAGMGGGGYAAQQAPVSGAAGGGAGWSHQESHPSSSAAPGGFRAFSGQGNKLGGS